MATKECAPFRQRPCRRTPSRRFLQPAQVMDQQQFQGRCEGSNILCCSSWKLPNCPDQERYRARGCVSQDAPAASRAGPFTLAAQAVKLRLARLASRFPAAKGMVTLARRCGSTFQNADMFWHSSTSNDSLPQPIFVLMHTSVIRIWLRAGTGTRSLQQRTFHEIDWSSI